MQSGNYVMISYEKKLCFEMYLKKLSSITSAEQKYLCYETHL